MPSSQAIDGASPKDVTLVVERGGAVGRRIRLRSPETIIGRQKGCDIRIPSAEISRRHCLLTFADGELSVQDLDSSNGTFVNRQRVSGSQVVHAGDRLRIGPLTFSVDYNSPPKVRAHPDAAKPDEGVVERDEEAVVPVENNSDQAPVRLATEDVIPFKDNVATTEIPDVELVDVEPPHLPEGEDLRDLLSKLEH